MTSLGARVWPWVPVGLLSCMLAGLGTMAAIAVRDPSFALERDYYAKAVAYDRVIAQRGENARLAWSIQTDVGDAVFGSSTSLLVKARDAGGPLIGARVSVEAIRNASAQHSLETALVERAPGEYEGRLPLERGGLWELRLTLVRGADRFTTVERRDIVERLR